MTSPAIARKVSVLIDLQYKNYIDRLSALLLEKSATTVLREHSLGKQIVNIIIAKNQISTRNGKP